MAVDITRIRTGLARTLLATTLLTGPGPVAGSAARTPGIEPERETLIQLFQNTQDVLLTVNSEVMRYADRVQVLGSRVLDHRNWQEQEVEAQAFLPVLKELNRIKRALGLIRSGMESKYGKLRAFEGSLRERYPRFDRDIDHYFHLFDRVFEDSMARQDDADRRINRLKDWFRENLSRHARSARRPPREAPDPAGRPGPHLRQGEQEAAPGDESRRAQDREILGKLQQLMAP